MFFIFFRCVLNIYLYFCTHSIKRFAIDKKINRIDMTKSISIDINRIDISEDEISKLYSGLLDSLLVDRTRTHYSGSTSYLVWGTDDYSYMGESYAKDKPITPNLVTGENNGIIKPRILKNEELRKSRTEDKAEVFTPAWICNSQNNLLDDAWFGTEGIFNTENADKTWTSVPKGQIHIPDNYDWKQYVKLQRLEMACGEAPYLASRYDVTTGEIIPVQDRIGLLDRKFKLINQFTKSEPTKLNKREWRRWALRALQSVYGFDWQGDNVLLAREALLLTYIDFYVDKWGKFPLKEALEKPVEVISWNIWQMDGLQGTLPGVEGIPMLQRMSNNQELFEDETLCLIKEWHKQEPPAGENIRFVDLINNK